MSDLEQQLTGVLSDVAEDAPVAVGLAEAARRRHRSRRQRRVAAGGAVAVLAVVGGVVALAGVGGDDRASDPVDDPTPHWQVVELDGGSMSLPPDWESVRCDGAVDGPPIYGPPDRDVCADGIGAVVLPVEARGEDDHGSLVSGDGGWLGYVTADEQEVRVFHPDRSLVRQVLSTVRLDGEPAVDGSRWVAFDRQGLTYEVPAWWGLGEDADRSPYSVCLVTTDVPGRQAFRTDDAVVLTDRSGPGDVVRVTAPTQALAELVLATVDSSGATASEDCGPEDFTTGLLPGESTPGSGSPVESTERPLDLPTSDWREGDGAMQALIGGVLQLDGDCVVVGGRPIVWPADYSATVDPSGVLTLRGPDGAVVAHGGDRVEMGGGWLDGPRDPHPCLPASGEVPYVQSEVTVVR